MSLRIRRRALLATAMALVGGATLAGPVTPIAAAPPSPDPVIAAVGDIACQSFSQSDGEGACRSDEVAALITDLAPDRFLALGDLQYNKGALDEFLRVWDRQFGQLKPITMPTPGNHEYGTDGAQGYFDYFGPVANGPEGYYSFDLGAWHVVSLNSDICRDDPGCGPGTAQYEWLEADLADDDAMCTLAFQHHPTFDWRQWQKFVDPDDPRPNGGSENEMYLDLWRLMDGHGVDVMLAGHNHIYHRWAPQDVDGTRDALGIRQFTVGTGGRSLYPLGKKPRPANLLAVQNKAFGVLRLTLHDESYSYAWVGLPTDPAFRDRGTFDCR
ncbi:MAG: metallophosphoesterase family protein [Actinomycetota bacterium]